MWDTSNLDQPNLDQPNLDQPNLDQPNLDQPNLDQPNLDRQLSDSSQKCESESSKLPPPQIMKINERKLCIILNHLRNNSKQRVAFHLTST